MPVSKSSLIERWKREGRWEDIDIEKNARIKELRSSGILKAAAGEQAWQEMADKYPPIEPKQEPKTFEPIADLAGDNGDFVAAAQWAFDNLARDVEPKDAPSAGAWSLLKWARNSEDDFFKSIMPKALDIRAKQGGAVDEQAIEELSECEGIQELLV